MYKKLFFLLLIPAICSGQIQIGQDIYGESARDLCGVVACSGNGNIIAVGSPENDSNGKNSGHVRVYENIQGTWTQIGQDLEGTAPEDRNGRYIGLSTDGTILAISSSPPTIIGVGTAPGYVRVFRNVSGSWVQIGHDIVVTNSGAMTLSADGNTVAVGSIEDTVNGKNSGLVRIYRNVSNIWTQEGQDINGEAALDMFGRSVSLSADGSIVAVGAPQNDGVADSAGHVRVYQNIAGSWTQVGQDIDGEAFADDFGNSVSLSADGTIVAGGATGYDKPGTMYGGHGNVRVFKNISGSWTQVGQSIVGESTADNSGYSISLSDSGTIIAIGAPYNHKWVGASLISTGHVRVYQYISNQWVQQGIDIDGDADSDLSGSSVSLSGDGSILAVGANKNNGNGIDSGQVKVYDLSGVLTYDSFVKANFNVYPNPATEIINITLENELLLDKVIIYTSTGQIVKTAKETAIDVSALAKGLYYVEVVTDKGKASTKVILE